MVFISLCRLYGFGLRLRKVEASNRYSGMGRRRGGGCGFGRRREEVLGMAARTIECAVEGYAFAGITMELTIGFVWPGWKGGFSTDSPTSSSDSTSTH
jgi:hypothetical protein